MQPNFRTHSHRWITLLLCGWVWHPLAAPSLAAAPPNILFVLAEDQGAHLSCLGTPGLLTPHIDRLAETGTVFRNAFVAYPVCSASKAALMTGLHNHVNGILNNTVNYHKPASELTPAETRNPLYNSNRIRPEIVTLTTLLHHAGYYQGVSHKLHVAPVEKFPYDEFLKHNDRQNVAEFISRAGKRPWFLLYNIPQSHRPYPNSDKVKIRVNPAEVRLPAFLPETQVVRQDWSEYLAGIEEVDRITQDALEALDAAGQRDNTYIIYLGDHGPTFQHGKMTLHDLGLRVPLIISGPGLRRGVTTDALASELDFLPTVLDLIGLPPVPTPLHGVSLADVVREATAAPASLRAAVFAEISNRGNLPNDGMQERSVCDGRWKLIYREQTGTAWRQVNADSREWKTWGNRTYDETVRVKADFPELFRILAEQDPQTLGGVVPEIEFYDLSHDPDEMHNLATDPAARQDLLRLANLLRQWGQDTYDVSVSYNRLPPNEDP